MVKKMTTILFTLAFLLSGCSYFPWLQEKALVTVRAGLLDESGSRVVNPGDEVTTITSYQVIFRKVEIGNSEEDKFTLWDNSTGETEDIVAPVVFGDPVEVLTGTYNYVRLTIDEDLAVAGSIDDDGTIYSGQGSCILADTVYLWGTNLENWEGDVTLAEPIEINGDCVLSFTFDIAGSVTYEGGPAEAAVLSVQKPVMTVEVVTE